jgi:integrase
VNRSTKLLNRQKAQALADKWEAAAKLAGRRELVQAAAVRVLDELMVATIGEEFKRETIHDYFHKWMNEPGRHGERSEATLKAYKTQITGFLAHLGEERSKASIASLTAAEIESWRNSELRSGKSAKTVNTAVGTLRAALEKAFNQGMILHNPAKAVAKIEVAGDEKLPFTRKDVLSLLRAAGDTDWRGMVVVGAFTGARLTDVAGLTWGNVNLEQSTLSFVAQKTKKTAPKPLLVAMHPQIVELLKGMPRGEGQDPLFPSLHSRASGSAGGLSNEFAALMKRAGLVVERGSEKKGKGRVVNLKSFHSFRHFFITELVSRDVNADIRKKMAGHSSDSAHARYVHLSLNHQRKAMAKLPRVG